MVAVVLGGGGGGLMGFTVRDIHCGFKDECVADWFMFYSHYFTILLFSRIIIFVSYSLLFFLLLLMGL